MAPPLQYMKAGGPLERLVMLNLNTFMKTTRGELDADGDDDDKLKSSERTEAVEA